MILWCRGFQVAYIATSTSSLGLWWYHLSIIFGSSHIRMSGNSVTLHTDVCQLYVNGERLRTCHLSIGHYSALLGSYIILIYVQGSICTARPLYLGTSIWYYTIDLNDHVHHISIEKYLFSHATCLMFGPMLYYR